jgi:serine/threonine protein kinase
MEKQKEAGLKRQIKRQAELAKKANIPGSDITIDTIKEPEKPVVINVAETKEIKHSFIDDLQKEVQLMMRLKHPNIVSIYQVIESENECYIVMEHAKGELSDYIAVRDHLMETEARTLFRQLVSAIDHCHQAGVIHRDLKLENLLISEKGEVLVSDFGLGRGYNHQTILSEANKK